MFSVEYHIVLPCIAQDFHEARVRGSEQAAKSRLSLAELLLHAIHAYRHGLFLLLFMKSFESLL
jgi:hypothetical protein